ncbi:MAG: hypothetical protein KKE64_01605, partial [Candidatus Omnitrophica bacterium]|nr:hypothetical protein [Candidatus Omnitrophota bacterium]
MRKYTKIACLIIFSILLLGLATYSYAAKIAIVTNVDNPDYKNCRETFEREIKREGPANGIDIDFVYLDTKGDKAAFISGVNNLAAEVDLFFVAGTPNALAIKEAGVTKPVLFNAIAGPVGAKLVNSLEAPGTNFTGVHCAVPEDRQLRALLLAVPNVRRIGLLYNPSDPAPAGQAKKWKDAIMGKEGLEIREFFIPETVNSAEALAEVTRALVGQVDVIVST